MTLSADCSHRLPAERLRRPPESGQAQTDPDRAQKTAAEKTAAARLHQTFKWRELVRCSVFSEPPDNRGFIPRVDHKKPVPLEVDKGYEVSKIWSRPAQKRTSGLTREPGNPNLQGSRTKDRHSLPGSLAVHQRAECSLNGPFAKVKVIRWTLVFLEIASFSQGMLMRWTRNGDSENEFALECDGKVCGELRPVGADDLRVE